MTSFFANLVQKIYTNPSVTEGTMTLIEGLVGCFSEAGTDPIKLQAAVVGLTESGAQLAEAVVANTPAVKPAA